MSVHLEGPVVIICSSVLGFTRGRYKFYHILLDNCRL